MQTFDSARNEFLLLIGHTSPITHRLAADRIHRMRELAKSAEEIGHVRQATHVWLSTVSTLVRMTKQITDETLPLVVIVKQDMDKGSSGQGALVARRQPPAVVEPVCGDCKEDDGFLDDVPFDETPRAPKVRPSKVIQPGPLDVVLGEIRGLESEDELRRQCIFGPEMFKDGRLPRLALVDSPTIKASNATIVKMYRERRIERTWAEPGQWDVETALVEDITLLLILVHGECSTDHINLHIRHLLPFVRRWDAIKLGFACRRAHDKFVKARVIARVKPRTFELTSGWDEKLRPTLLEAWELARDTDTDGGTTSSAGVKA